MCRSCFTSGAESTVFDEPQLVREVDNLGDSFGQVDTIAVEAIVARVVLVRLVGSDHEERIVFDAHHDPFALLFHLFLVLFVALVRALVESHAFVRPIVTNLNKKNTK